MTKKNKIVVIDSCSHCPYYDDFYPWYVRNCKLLDKVIEFGDPFPRDEDKVDIITNVYGTPPDECPLQDTDEKPINLENITRK